MQNHVCTEASYLLFWVPGMTSSLEGKDSFYQAVSRALKSSVLRLSTKIRCSGVFVMWLSGLVGMRPKLTHFTLNCRQLQCDNVRWSRTDEVDLIGILIFAWLQWRQIGVLLLTSAGSGWSIINLFLSPVMYLWGIHVRTGFWSMLLSFLQSALRSYAAQCYLVFKWLLLACSTKPGN